MKIKNIFITKKGECNCKSMSLVPSYKSVKVTNRVCGDSSIYPVIYAHTSCFLTTKTSGPFFFFKLYLKNQRNHTLPLSSTTI